ncbi:MAG TPA: hypothetical protein VMP03_07390 [Methylomirabilota bacterium]|nr:hypothetical protein [Methylomirabilota bacterium]
MTSPHRLIPSVEGAIDTLLLCLPAALVAGDAPIAEALLTTVAPNAHRIVVTHARAARTVSEIGAGNRMTILSCPDDTPLSVWSQDALISYSGPDDITLAPSAPAATGTPARRLFQRLADAGVASIHGEGLPARAGNLLVGDDFVLVGADEWRRWAAAGPGDNGDDAALAFFQTRIDAHRRPVVVGCGSGRSPGPSRRFKGPDGQRWRENREPGVVERGSLQPAYHTDLYATLAGRSEAGRSRVVVGDLTAAARSCGSAAPPDRAAEFDAVAAFLDTAGFDVTRCPLALIARDDPEHRQRHWFFASWNNALVEDAGRGGRRVFLPVYGDLGSIDLTAADECACAAWTSFGYQVVAIPGLHGLARMGGGLHCAAKVLRRS